MFLIKTYLGFVKIIRIYITIIYIDEDKKLKKNRKNKIRTRHIQRTSLALYTLGYAISCQFTLATRYIPMTQNFKRVLFASTRELHRMALSWISGRLGL